MLSMQADNIIHIVVILPKLNEVFFDSKIHLCIHCSDFILVFIIGIYLTGEMVVYLFLNTYVFVTTFLDK